MIRGKLPGSLKTKKIILTILVSISIILIGYNFVINNNNDKKQLNTIEEETFIKSASEESDDIEENNNISSVEEFSEEENQLYEESYNLFFSNKYTEAIYKADQLIDKYPDSYMGYNIRGIAKSYNGNFYEGMKDIDKSLSIKNDYGYARFNKALSYELHGDMNEAIEWYKKALDIEDYVWSYYGIASIYGRKGDVENTMKYLNKAIEIDSNVKENAKNEEDFDPVKNSKEFQQAVYH